MSARAQLTAEQKKAAQIALDELRRLAELHNAALYCAFGVHEIVDYYVLPIAPGALRPAELPDAIAAFSELIRTAETVEPAPMRLRAAA